MVCGLPTPGAPGAIARETARKLVCPIICHLGGLNPGAPLQLRLRQSPLNVRVGLSKPALVRSRRV